MSMERITKKIAEKFLRNQNSVDLREATSIDDDAAEALSKHRGDYLILYGLKEISDVTAESLSKYQGELILSGLTSLSDAAAQSFSKHEGGLDLADVGVLSDAAVVALAKSKGELRIGVSEVSESAVKALVEHEGINAENPSLVLPNLISLDDVSLAEKLVCECEYGEFFFEGLTSLAEAVAQSLSRAGGYLHFGALKDLSTAAASALAGGGNLESLEFSSLESLPDSVAKELAKFQGEHLSFGSLGFISDAAVKALAEYGGELFLGRNHKLCFSPKAARYLLEGNATVDGNLDLDEIAVGEGDICFRIAEQFLKDHFEGSPPPQETLSIDTIKRYCRICAEHKGSDSDKASEYEDYILETLRLFNDTVREKVFDEHAPWDMVRLPQIDSLDEDLAECLSPVRCRLVLSNVKEVSQDCLNLLFSKKNKITLSRKYYHYHCLEIGLKSLDKAQATVLGKYTGQLSLPNLESIDAEAAKKLRGIAWNLRLGISEIDLETATALTDLLKKSQGRNLYLDRLTSVSTEALKALCENEGELSLGLEEVNAEQMALLTARKAMFELPKLRHCPAEALQLLVDFHSGAGYSEYGWLELNSFEELSVEGAAIVAKTKKATLSLNGLKSITAEVAKSLSSFRGNLFLKGILEIDADAAAHLANIKARGSEHHLELGAKTIDKNTAAELARFGGTLNLPALTELPAAAAKALAGHKGKWLYLGLTSVSDTAAKTLAGYQGGLYLKDLKSLQNAALAKKLASMDCPKLESLTELADAAAESLSKHEGDLELNALTSLSDAAAKSLSKHKGEALSLSGITELSDAAAEALAKYKGESVSLDGLKTISPKAARQLLESSADFFTELDLKKIKYAETLKNVKPVSPDKLEKIKCNLCEKMIPILTAEANDGLCGRCCRL